MAGDTLGLFQGIGIELEYMIVDAATLDVRPQSDRLLAAEAGEITTDVEFDDLSWSNELAAHVIELKTTGPVATLAGLAGQFGSHLARVERHAGDIGLRLMPTAMHPWMDPDTEMALWAHDYSDIYTAMHRIFNCRGHGWANLQSMHINLPFADDAEHARLHAAVRLVLPLLPAIAASSPFQDGRTTGLLDSRLENYRHHCDRVPSIVGRVIPEPIETIARYQEAILGRIYGDIAALDPEGILRNEFVNARGAISRFVRNTIEVRVIDVQECPAADLAIASAAIAAIRHLVGETWSGFDAQWQTPVDPLAGLFERAIAEGERTVIDDAVYLRLFGLDQTSATMGRLWSHIVDEMDRRDAESIAPYRRQLGVILERGPLARRILNATGADPTRDALRETYRRLCDCLRDGEMFVH